MRIGPFVLMLALPACVLLPTHDTDDAGPSFDAATLDLADAALFEPIPWDASRPLRDGGQRDAEMPEASVPSDASTSDASSSASDAGTRASTLLITQLRTRGPRGSNDEFVEITNVGDETIALGGLRLRAVGVSGAVGTRAIVPEGVVLEPGEHFLFANGGSAGYEGPALPDLLYTIGIADACGVAIADASGQVHDSLSTLAGTPLGEGAPRPPLTENADSSHARRRREEGGYVDTHDNASDFETLTPSTPRSSSSR